MECTVIQRIQYLTYTLLILLLCCLNTSNVSAQKKSEKQQIIQLKIYHLDNPDQEQQVDRFLDEAYLPALHRTGIEPVGVFKPVGQDTTADRRIYVLISFDSFEQFRSLETILKSDQQYQKDGTAYIEASHDVAPYNHIESIILEAFPYAPRVMTPDLNAPASQRVYELRSYWSATEALNRNKVEMFNEGGEVEIFDRLGFNAVFYGNVLSGYEMPNLMYMTSFEDMESRDAHWDAFRNDSKWEEISSMKKYQNNVEGISIQFLRTTDYSDL